MKPKTFAPRWLALTAAATLGMSGIAWAEPAAAGPVLTEDKAYTLATQIDEVNAFGFDNGVLHLGVENDEALERAEGAVKELQNEFGTDSVEIIAGVPEAEPHAPDDAVGGMGYIATTTLVKRLMCVLRASPVGTATGSLCC